MAVRCGVRYIGTARKQERCYITPANALFKQFFFIIR